MCSRHFLAAAAGHSRRGHAPALALAALLLTLAAMARAENWPQWRGPSGQGFSQEQGLPTEWGGPQSRNVLWKAELPAGHNPWSSPVVWGDRVFVTTATFDPAEHRVLCFSTKDGKPLWNTPVAPGKLKLEDRRSTYCAPTPVTDGRAVYVVFGSAVVAALDLDGKLLWRKELPRIAFDVAVGTSPVLYKDTLILDCDQTRKQSSIIAFDTKTGDVRWDALRPDTGFAHSTPLLANIGGADQLLVSASSALQGLDPTSGKVLWWAPNQGDAASPAYGSGLVYADSGRGPAGAAVDPNGTGQLSAANVRWKLSMGSESIGSPLITGGYLYRGRLGHKLACVEMATGREAYNEPLPEVEMWASPAVTSDGRIYFASGGKSYVLQAGPQFKLLATNDLGDRNPSSPAISGGRIFIRGTKYLWCIGAGAAQPAAAAAAPAEPGKWASFSDPVLAQLANDGKKPGWPGKTAGITVDRTTGDVYLVIPDQGLWKSTDQGKTFARVDGGKVGGRCETGYAIHMDPNGKHLMCFMVYGGCALSSDAGATWSASKVNHLDYGAVDWEATGRCMLSILHEKGGKMVRSSDGGQTWTELSDGFKALGLFDEKAMVASKGDGLLRSTDGGGTWTKVSDATPAGQVMQVFHGVGYWATAKGVLVSRDKGATWSILGAPVDAYYGPYFGKDERSLLVVGKEGVQLTADAGATWRKVAPLPPEFAVGFTGPNFGWDPNANVLYASSMGKDAFRCELGK